MKPRRCPPGIRPDVHARFERVLARERVTARARDTAIGLGGLWSDEDVIAVPGASRPAPQEESE